MKQKVKYFIVWGWLAFALFFRFYEGKVHYINATMFAFSYKYGFVSRGFIGTVYACVHKILPGDGLSYASVLHFNQVITAIFFMELAAFVVLMLQKNKENMQKYMFYILVFYTMFCIPFFSSHYNFGRLDLYCLMFSLLAAMTIICDKYIGLCIPLSVMGVMVHQGYVFMYFNIILALLLYRVFTKDGKRKRQYISVLAISFVLASVLFMYFELFSHFNGDSIYDEIISKATLLCQDGKIHQDVIDHEILGVDLTKKEIPYHLMNVVQFPIFILLMIPIIKVFISVFRKYIGRATTKKAKFQCFCIAAGALTMLPDLLLKVDFGRWMFAIISYYIVVVLGLLAIGDRGMEQSVAEEFDKIRQKNALLGPILMLYPMIFQPLMDVSICEVTAYLGGVLNSTLLHWW